MKKHLSAGLALAGALALSACGGGDDDKQVTSTPEPPPAPAAEVAQGLWNGTTDTGRFVTALVLSDGSHYVVYTAENQPEVLGGVVMGKGASTNGQFLSTSARDFNVCDCAGITPVAVSASVVPRQSLVGQVSVPPSTAPVLSFSARYDADYEQTPSLAEVAGSYGGHLFTSQVQAEVLVTVSGTGAVSGGNEVCQASGQLKPRADGNAYDVSLTFGGAPCPFAGQTLAGAAYHQSATGRLYLAAPDAQSMDAAVFAGMKLLPQEK